MARRPPRLGSGLPARESRRWTAQITGESWAGQTSGACNLYSYAFQNIGQVDLRTWRWAPVKTIAQFHDPNYRLVRHSGASFLAAATVQQAPRFVAAAPPVEVDQVVP